MAAKATRISISAAELESLERMAQRNDDVGLHVRIARDALDGLSIAASARRNCASRDTVRKWRARFAEAGIGGLSNRRRASPGANGSEAPDIPAVAVPVALLRGGGESGAEPSARLKIECAVRAAAALGRIRPGALLPGRAWFAERFSVSPPVVHRAFANLAAEGFVEARPRGETRIASRLPFEGRFLMVQEGLLPDNSSGICENMVRAARRTEALRPGATWEIIRRERFAPAEWRRPVERGIASQRWCGVFMRFAHTSTPGWKPGLSDFAGIPNVPVAVDRIFPGTKVANLVRELSLSSFEPLPSIFARCRREGLRRVIVADTFPDLERDREAEVRVAARRAGVAIPPFGYSAPSPADNFANIRRTFGMQLALAAGSPPDAILVLRDDLLKPLAAAFADFAAQPRTRRHPGGAGCQPVAGGASSPSEPPHTGLPRILCWSSGNLLDPCGLDVEWHGFDLVATLLSFMDWATAVRAGAASPLEPRAISL